ncbi:SpoIIE family protein phosphatase/ATP-binding protein [Streptomyces camelliae]|uniref:SpoIIE family protein phosphatase n=1 Tax=Streptomyces camelliae TaxID=3004093 RepID=A0ABY7PI51_9ACTN|nr:SpoIIE family protein phosphatase/ATP-binding protein [Streptomyces sp. HUAS 2-6]WBO69133.1 SpoIIE family protein phosphatase [Streptomyces sp. HUAS 2-6]
MLLVAAALVALVVQARRDVMTDASHRTLTVAQTFANSPGIVSALNSANPTAALQPHVEATRTATGVDAVIVYGLNGITLAHSDPRQVGKRVIGPYAAAATGTPFTSTFRGSLGLSVISAVPVRGPGGSVIAIVSVPVRVERVRHRVNHQLPVLLGGAATALVVAAGGSGLVSRRLRRQTHGLGPTEMTRMYEHHDAVLHAVREGVLIVGGDGRLLLANDEARRLLDLPADAERRHVTDLGLDEDLAGLLAGDRPATDEVYLAADRLLAVSKRLTAPHGPDGSVVTLRDTTELRAVSGRAEQARERLQSLYDAGLRIGTTLDVKRTAEELAEVAVTRFADVVTVDLLDPVLRGEESSGGAGITELRRSAVAGIDAGPPFHPVGELIRLVPADPVSTALAEGRPVLIRDLSASDAWRAQQPDSAGRIFDHGIGSMLAVPLRARGVMLGAVVFRRAEGSPAFEDEDVTFAEELAARAAVCIDNASRYTREHAMAVTLQHSLLPRALPEQSALDVAYRYLPAQAGVGGDWFDVIPLSGTRVALVVGDVVGHGLHAAATMGRLRTAVHNFAALDMPVEELLGRLDELVAQIDAEEVTAAEHEQGVITGATCQYAVYDPTSGRLAIATAGHPGPAVVRPDGTVDFPQLPVSPPLGLGAGLPVETAELTVPEDARLVLYTDGLIEDRTRDLDAGLQALRDALTGPGRTPEATCAAVMEAMLSDRPRDDIALLVARTRRLGPDQVAEWEVPRDPAAVAPVRTACARRLAEWGLERIGFTAELILSELITNAIRYGAEPIAVRLLRTEPVGSPDAGSLIFEVADGSSTSPRLRRAKVTDEGGRGLFLVARFAERWGTRYTATGKVIWAEHSLRPDATPEGEGLDELLLDQWDDTAL